MEQGWVGHGSARPVLWLLPGHCTAREAGRGCGQPRPGHGSGRVQCRDRAALASQGRTTPPLAPARPCAFCLQKRGTARRAPPSPGKAVLCRPWAPGTRGEGKLRSAKTTGIKLRGAKSCRGGQARASPSGRFILPWCAPSPGLHSHPRRSYAVLAVLCQQRRPRPLTQSGGRSRRCKPRPSQNSRGSADERLPPPRRPCRARPRRPGRNGLAPRSTPRLRRPAGSSGRLLRARSPAAFPASLLSGAAPLPFSVCPSRSGPRC